MSLAASDVEKWVGSSVSLAPLPSLEPIDTRAGMDANLLSVLSKAVKEISLE